MAYFESHKLRINVDKTKFMILHGSRQKVKINKINNIELKLTDQTIKQVKEAKYLGIIFDQTLSFKTQTKTILKKHGSWHQNYIHSAVFCTS